MAFPDRKLKPGIKPKESNDFSNFTSNPCFANNAEGCNVSSNSFSPPPMFLDGDQTNPNQHISLIMILMFFFVGGSLVFFLYLTVLTRNRINNSRRRNHENLDHAHEDVIDEDDGPVWDHPIWLINTIGLSQSVIDSISVFKFKTDQGLIEGTDCSVCLSEFQEDESLRLLPKCSHAFHIPCIDTWLRSHKNCPLCRAPIVSDSNGNNPMEISNSYDLGPVEGIQPENSENFVRITTQQLGENETNAINSGAENSGDLLNQDEEINSAILDKRFRHLDPTIRQVRVLSDLADHRVARGGELERVRRSISLDFSSASNTQSVQVKKTKFDLISRRRSRNSGIFKLMKSSSFGRSLQKGPVSMKRSFSQIRNRGSQESICPL